MNYERMGIAQIRRVAQGRGIEYAKYFRKHELVTKLLALDARPLISDVKRTGRLGVVCTECGMALPVDQQVRVTIRTGPDQTEDRYMCLTPCFTTFKAGATDDGTPKG